MEKDKFGSDPHEEVRKLKEKVRALEFQLSQQSSVPTNGANGASVVTVEIDVDCEILPVDNLVDLSNINIWLMRSISGKNTSSTEVEAISTLRDPQLSQVEKVLYNEVCNAEQDRGKCGGLGIDSRTFTRPKKRFGRPNVEVLESIHRLSKASEPDLSWASPSGSAETGALSDMTSSVLLASSVTNSLTASVDSPPDDAQLHLHLSNKKQRVITLDKSPVDVCGNLDTFRDSARSGPATFEISEGEAMEISSPDMETTDNSLGIVDSRFLDVGLMDSISYSSKPLENASSTIKNPLNTTFTPPSASKFSTFKKNEGSLSLKSGDESLNTTFLEDTLVPNAISPTENDPNDPMDNHRKHLLNVTFTPSDSDSSFMKPVLNSTYTQSPKEICGEHPLNSTFTPPSNICHEKVPFKSTFTSTPNGTLNHGIISSLPRPASTDSGGVDDDQMSSTSDSSHTSATRLMSVGDVQNIARLQEESLVMSTPKQSFRVTSKVFDDTETVSPIMSKAGSETEIHTVGYGSDQSHSSRSPLSSLQSSPASSPYGSSTALPTSQPRHFPDPKIAFKPNGVLQRRDTYSMIPPMKSKVGGLRPPAIVSAATVPAAAAPRIPSIRSGLRPPMVRSRVSVAPAANTGSGLPRPAGTGIPRPSQASSTRIPPPKIRASSATRKKEWSDECY